MSGVDRDIQCGNSFERLFNLGCFDEEFQFYGFSFLHKNKIKYWVGSNEENIYRFIDMHRGEDFFFTTVEKWIRHCQVPSGERENIKQQYKIELAQELHDKYDAVLFNAIRDLADHSPNDSALGLLTVYQDRINGRFRKHDIAVFSGLCTLAYESKLLTPVAYLKFMEWVEQVHKQMENDTVEKDQFKRSFYGFFYRKSNTNYTLFYDAQRSVVQSRWHLYRQKGCICSPVINESYFFHALNQLSSKRNDFKNILNEYLESDVKTILEELYTLPAAINYKMYEKWRTRVEKECSREALETYIGYGHIWHLE